MNSTIILSRRNLGALTGLRFVAAMAVYFYHFGAGFIERLGAPQPAVNVLKNGYVGVSVFFVLSGFILYYTYQGSVTRWSSYKEFMTARFARIYPVYVLVLLVALPVTTRPTDLESMARVLTMTQAWTLPESDLGFAWLTQAWTLSIELFFYLMFPFYAAAVAKMRVGLLLPAGIAMALLMVAGGLPTVTPSTLGAEIPSSAYQLPIPILRSVEFIYGIIMCRLFLCQRPQVQGLVSSTASVAIVVLAIVVLLAYSTDRRAVATATVFSGVLSPP